MDDSMESKRRSLVVVLAAVSSFMIFITTERCFIKADIRNAITMVKTLRSAPEHPTIPEALVKRHPEASLASIGWDGELTNNCYGFVRVRAAVPAPGEVAVYYFDVNLSGQRLHPANDKASALMANLRAPSQVIQAPVIID